MEFSEENIKKAAEEYFESLCITPKAKLYPTKGFIAGVKWVLDQKLKNNIEGPEDFFKDLANTEFFKPSNSTLFGFQSERLKRGSEIVLLSSSSVTGIISDFSWLGKIAIIKKIIEFADGNFIMGKCVLKNPSESTTKKQMIIIFKKGENGNCYTEVDKVIKY